MQRCTAALRLQFRPRAAGRSFFSRPILLLLSAREGPVEQTQYVKLIHESCALIERCSEGSFSKVPASTATPMMMPQLVEDSFSLCCGEVGLQVCPSGTTYTWSIGCPNEPAPGELWT